ncbi:hypothetical protein ACHQM5_030038 [Ranunculus cassubicifolius]
MPSLSQEYWDEEILMSIAMGVGNPMQVDEKTLNRNFGYFAQVLVDVDFGRPIPEQVMVRAPKIGDKPAKDFWQTILIPKYPKLCSHCKVVGHLVQDCTVLNKEHQNQSQVRSPEIQVEIPPSIQTHRATNQNLHTGESSNAHGNGAVNGRGESNEWQTRNGRQNRNWVPRNKVQNSTVQNQRPRFGVQTNGNRYQVLQREEAIGNTAQLAPSISKEVVANPMASAVAIVTPELGTLARIDDPVLNDESEIMVEVPSLVEVEPTMEAPTLIERMVNIKLTLASPREVVAVIDDVVQAPSSAPIQVVDPSTLEDFGHDSLNVLAPSEVIPMDDHVRHEIEDPGDPGGEIVNEEINAEQAQLLKEASEVQKLMFGSMSSSENQRWADLLDEDDDEGNRNGRSDVRPSLSQPRRSERSRSRSRLLEPYVTK